MARYTAVGISGLAIIMALFAQGFNVAFLVALAFAVAASANAPVILLTIFWKRFNTTGAIAGILTGLVTFVGIMLLSPSVLTGTSPEQLAAPTALISADAIIPFKNLALFSVPLAFLACFVGTLLGGLGAERERQQGIQVSYDEIHVRSLTGISNVEKEVREAAPSGEPQSR